MLTNGPHPWGLGPATRPLDPSPRTAMRSLLSTASIVLLLAGASPAAAASIQLQIDHSERLTIAGSAASVLVGNPAVADVTVVDKGFDLIFVPTSLR